MNAARHIIRSAHGHVTCGILAPAAIAGVLATAAIAECPPRFEITLIEGPDCTVGGPNPHARAINALGHIVGDTGCSGAGDHALAWYGEDPVVLLPEPPNTYRSWAGDMNKLGWIVGSAEITTTSGIRGLIWHDGVIDVIEPFAGDLHASTGSVNDLGHVLGSSGSRAFLWIDGVITNLHDLVNTAPESVAADINELDQIVGWLDWPGPENEMAMLIDDETVIDWGIYPVGQEAKHVQSTTHR